jgi:hypothetical protein
VSHSILIPPEFFRVFLMEYSNAMAIQNFFFRIVFNDRESWNVIVDSQIIWEPLLTNPMIPVHCYVGSCQGVKC